jgi:hypothetical protein
MMIRQSPLYPHWWRALSRERGPRRSLRQLAAGVSVLLASCIGGTSEGREPALPDPETFKREVRARLLGDRELQSRYTYIEKREEIDISNLGGVSEGPVKVYEVYPSREPGGTYKRLISVDGVPLTPAELAKGDRKHQRDLRRDRERRQRETAQERKRRLEKEADEQRERAAIIDEIFDAYDIRLVGREAISGNQTVVVTLEPLGSHSPRTDEGELMKKLRVKAWISESDYELVRVEARVIEDVTVGWGIIGRLHAGTWGLYERRKVNGEVWLPLREVVDASGRTLLVRTFKVNTLTEWSGYRRITTEERDRFTQVRRERSN